MAKTKTREEVKDMWWKVMAKILLAEHRERREKEEVASTWERARSAASVTEGTSRPSSPISFVSSEGTDSSLRPEDCFSTVSGGSVHSEDDGEDEEAVQAASNDSSNPEFDEWYAEWFSQWVLETSRKLRSPESESRFSSYSISSSAASSVNGSDHHEEEVEGNASDEEEDINMIRTRPSTPTPFSSPIIIAVRGRDRYRRRLSLSGSSSSDSSPSPPTRRNSSIPPSSPAYRSPSRRRRRLPSPFCTTKGLPNPSSPIFRRRTPSPLNINHFPLPPSTLLSPVFPTASSPSSHPSSRSSSRSNSRPCCRSPSQSPSRSPSRPSSPLSSRPSSPTATQHFQVQDQWQHKGRPMNAKTEDYLSNAHLLRFPATVSARLMMTAETLGVAGEGKRKLRTPTVSEPVNEAKWRRASEEVKGFDWGFGMGRVVVLYGDV
ncbi:hypothetical protein B0H65DRAFT_512034 [Neurospora tetraspora]|uniref:Uncharacterized protein n=1 Tax=Neurospora tetraspora TaxID=94610 RepID=A0AAE0MML1_9PEZI|nr:hypothetical protein B0H65DRAFT_512034 [Neurospora tetraspora]